MSEDVPVDGLADGVGDVVDGAEAPVPVLVLLSVLLGALVVPDVVLPPVVPVLPLASEPDVVPLPVAPVLPLAPDDVPPAPLEPLAPADPDAPPAPEPPEPPVPCAATRAGARPMTAT